jgi:hypothetical protein
MRLSTEPSVNSPARPALPIQDSARQLLPVLCNNAKRTRRYRCGLHSDGYGRVHRLRGPLLALSFTLAALLLLPMIARADDAVFTFGRGTRTSCGQFIAAMEAHKIMQQQDGVPHMSERALMMEYVDGLLTGLNLSRDRAHQIRSDNAAIELWLRSWCARHPTNSLVDAVAAFSAETPGTPTK